VETLEPVAISVILEHAPEDCPFCKSNEAEKPNPVPESKDVQDLDEDPDAQLIDNASGELDRKMKGAQNPRPRDWVIDLQLMGLDDPKHKVIANPHHLIPGNESLKEAQTLLPWIFANKGKIENDIGYNVNNAENGIWLPSNNSMRGHSHWKSVPGEEKKGKDGDPAAAHWQTNEQLLDFQTKFVVAAMDEAGKHFHDRHPDYSDSVTAILNKIADRMNGVDQDLKCPYKTEEAGGGKFKPPYALVARLNGVSRRVAGYLSSGARPQASFYTSRLVLQYWKAKGRI